MIVHQHKGVQLLIVRFHCSFEPLEPAPAIPVVGDDVSPLNPAGHHMIEGPFVFHTQWSRHARKHQRPQESTQG